MDPEDFGNRKFWFGVAIGATMALEWMEAKTIKESIPPKPKVKPNTAMFPNAKPPSPPSLKATHVPSITPVEARKSDGHGEDDVQKIKQGYLLKRSSSLSVDWKRHFFILDSHGELYYHRQNESRPGNQESGLFQYVEKLLVKKEATGSGISCDVRIWGAFSTNKLQDVYCLIVTSDLNIINTTYDEVAGTSSYQYSLDYDTQKDFHGKSNESYKYFQGCTLLHVACSSGNFVMVELLLRFGPDINRFDHRGRTPLHHCICSGNNELAKFLLRIGARASIKDGGGLGASERAMEMGAISDEELFVLLLESM